MMVLNGCYSELPEFVSRLQLMTAFRPSLQKQMHRQKMPLKNRAGQDGDEADTETLILLCNAYSARKILILLKKWRTEEQFYEFKLGNNLYIYHTVITIFGAMRPANVAGFVAGYPATLLE
ncbi:hypothetical protein [uncultured Roseobacter sp.]|uniref:hypothetical protein n=1 Tax=uncultured Roseobacter sp. TaxID=114847 RepID=UPI002614D5A3|nr:hypothetical protein [uncultured Roseobacter sp.]